MSPPHSPDPRFLTLFVDASFCHRTHGLRPKRRRIIGVDTPSVLKNAQEKWFKNRPIRLSPMESTSPAFQKMIH